MARNNNNRKASNRIKRNAQRGIGAHSFEELQQRAAAIKNKKAVNVIAKKPAEAILEVLATPDQTPGPTPNKSTASSRNNSGCLDGSDEAPFSASAHVSSLEAELNCESPRGPSSSFLEDEHLQMQVPGSEGTAAQPFAELSNKGGQRDNPSPEDLLPEDKSPAAPTTEADLPAKTTDDKVPEGSAAVAVLTTPLEDISDTAPTDQSEEETPDCHWSMKPSLIDIPVRQETAWSTPSHTSSPSITAAEGTVKTLLPLGDMATGAPVDDNFPAEPPTAQDAPSRVEEEDVSAPATTAIDFEPESVDQRSQVAPKESTKTSPQTRNWLASRALHTCSWVQAACTRWLGQPWAPKAVMPTMQLSEAAPLDLTAALDSAWHYQLLT